MTGPASRRAARIAISIVLFTAVSSLPACAGGAREVRETEPDRRGGAASSADFAEGEEVILTGRVKAKGNEPFSFAALETDAGVFKLVGPKADDLFREHQMESVKIRGVVAAAGEPPILPPEIEVRRYRPVAD